MGHSQIIPYLLNLNKIDKYNFTIISFEKKQPPDSLIKFIKKNNINWYHLKFTHKYFFLIKFFDFFKIIFFPLLIIILFKIDLLHCRGHLPAISGLIAKKIFRKKFVFDCRGLWADERLDNRSWNKKYFLHDWSYVLFKKLEYLFFKASDHNVVLTSNIKNYLIKKNHFSKNSFSVIPCAANYDHFKILNKSQIISKKKELNIERYEFIIGYFGSISNIYHPNEMINFFLFCKKIYKKSLIIFFSNDFNYLFNKTTNFKKLNQSDYMCIYSSYDKLPIYYNICDMTLSFVKKTKARVASSPTKIGESLACGVNVLSNKGIGDLDLHLNFNKFSLVDVKKDKELKKMSLSVKDIKNLNREKIRQYSKKNYDLDLAVQTYKKIYLDLFSPNSLK